MLVFFYKKTCLFVHNYGRQNISVTPSDHRLSLPSLQQKSGHARTAPDEADFYASFWTRYSKHFERCYGQSVNKEYLSQIQLYSMFGQLPVLRNTVLIITVCVKVANSTF